MLLLSGQRMASVLSAEARILGESSRVGDLVELTKQLHEVSDAVKHALIGIVVRKRLERRGGVREVAKQVKYKK